jgi:hypothetical protein
MVFFLKWGTKCHKMFAKSHCPIAYKSFITLHNPFFIILSQRPLTGPAPAGAPPGGASPGNAAPGAQGQKQ